MAKIDSTITNDKLLIITQSSNTTPVIIFCGVIK